MVSAARIQTLGEVVCVSLGANARGKGMNRSDPPQQRVDDKAEIAFLPWLDCKSR